MSWDGELVEGKYLFYDNGLERYIIVHVIK